MTRPLEALAARVEVANHQLESLPAIIHQIVKQIAIDASKDQLQTIMEALGKPDETSITEDIKTLNAMAETCLATVSAGPCELPTRQKADRRLGTVDGVLNKQGDIVEAEVEVGVPRTVQSVTEKANAATGDVKKQVIDFANDMKESLASMSDMSSGVKSDEALAEKFGLSRAVLVAVRRKVDFALKPYDSEVDDATTSQVKKRVESMQQIVDAYRAHIGPVPRIYGTGLKAATAEVVKMGDTLVALKKEAELLGKLVPDIVDMQGKANAQARRIHVLEEEVNSMKLSENIQPSIVEKMRRNELMREKVIAQMEEAIDSQARFIATLKRTVDSQDTLIGNLRREVDSANALARPTRHEGHEDGEW